MKEILHELLQWKSKTRANLHQVQSLIGKLSFCVTTVRSGRLFYNRILNFLKELKKLPSPWMYRDIPQEVFKDINWWVKVMPQLNGISLIPDKNWKSPNSVIATDACLSAIGGWSQGEFFHARFPEFVEQQRLSINELECVAIMVALKKWGYKLNGLNALFQCDNTMAVQAINSGKASNSYMQAVLREIAFLCAINDCMIRVVSLSGAKNKISDSLSRLHLHEKYKIRFIKYTRGLHTFETKVKEEDFLFSNVW